VRLFVLISNKGNVDKQSGISGATGESQDPTFQLHDDRVFHCRSLGYGQRQFGGDNGGSVEMLWPDSVRMHFN
jgi:hypothetical protein